MGKKDLKRTANDSQNLTEMFKRKKPSSAKISTTAVASPLSATTSAISVAPLSSATTPKIYVASPSSATVSTVSQNQQSDHGDAPHQPKKKFSPRKFGKKKITKCSFLQDWFVTHPWIH